MEIRFSEARIRELFRRLSARLQKEGILGEILLFGGAAMILGWKARQPTRDIDAVFEPAAKIRRLAKALAEDEGLPEGWLNDAVKGFIDRLPSRKDFRQVVFSTEHLRIYTPPAEYLIAMKALSARTGPEHADVEDMKFLIRKTKLKSAKDVFDIVSRYYPTRPIAAKTLFFVESIFEELKKQGKKRR